MNIRIKTKDSITGFTIPCREEQIDKLCEVLGISNNSQAAITVDSVYMDDRANALLQNKTFNLDKLNFLAKRLDSFDGKEMTTFYAVAYGEQIENIDSLINLTFNTHCASVVSDFSDLDAIGKSMYLTEQGGVTMEELNRLNGEEYFKKVLADNPNPLVTPYGILYKNKNEFEQVYDGTHFPEYYWEENMGTVTLNKDGFAEYLYLPYVETELTNCYAYRKGADGEPEIIPEEAEIIKLIYKLYLNGRGVTTIVGELNDRKVKSHAKDGLWRASTVQSILENERYCGDMLLQKSFIVDPISKKSRKNNGELPKYLIQNNHPAIVSRESFEQAQAEKARRGSKKKVSKKSVTEQSRYSGLYALNEILICGECLTPYRRVVWTNPKTKAKKAVWRCVSRLDYGTKYCKDSISVDEESLHSAIMEAINATRGSRQQMIPYFIQQLKQSYKDHKTDKLDIEQIEQRIEELKTTTMALVQESVLSNTVGENEY